MSADKITKCRNQQRRESLLANEQWEEFKVWEAEQEMIAREKRALDKLVGPVKRKFR